MSEVYKIQAENVMNFLKNLKSHERILCSQINYKTNKKLTLFFNVNGLRYSLKVYNHGKLVHNTKDITEQDVIEAVNKYNYIH